MCVGFVTELGPVMDMKAYFTGVFDNKVWGDHQTVSGPGSTLEYTANLRRELPMLFDRFAIRSVLDAPCGDMNWMKPVLSSRPFLDYTGGDIVKGLVQQNTKAHGRKNIRFLELDLTKDALPKADLMICRDCMIHLPQAQIFDVLRNFKKSGIGYLLATTYIVDDNFNTDIPMGNFFPIDLMAPPYNFPKNHVYAINDWIEGFYPRRMCLWGRSQIPDF